ncbi:hypothetical protein JRO89_XS14G0059200 [Xanthoceras sorbifolium]|uniref:Uncharacterized protein n=1 Tax=Xanthoceras sorbifolium TaxID=99658 RepID=A0ABQ8H422_9ROSI|nr:hypothetical protein JRO89_XS14G0059200 [Xanthoceras sorbifolium]
MVLSNKKLKQKLRDAIAESLTSSSSSATKPVDNESANRDPNSQTQSLKQLLDSATQKPRFSKREKKRRRGHDSETTLNSKTNGGSVVVVAVDDDDNKNTGVEKESQNVDLVGDENGGEKKRKKEKEKEKKQREEGESGNLGEEGEGGAVEEAKKPKTNKKKKKKQKNKKKKQAKIGEEEDKTGGDGVVGNEEPNKGSDSQVNNDYVATRVYVGGIPYSSTENDIKRYFESCGTIDEIDCMSFPDSGRFRGIAIITFRVVGLGWNCNLARLTFDAAMLGSGKVHKLSLWPSLILADLIVFVGHENSSNFIKFKHFAEWSLFPASLNFIIFLVLQTEGAAKRALALDGSEMDGLLLKIQPYKTTTRVNKTSDFAPRIVEGYNRIYVGNLSWDITEEDLRKLFSDCKIDSIRFGMDKETGEFRGYAHVDFSDSLSLTMALKLDQEIACGRPVKISCAVPKKVEKTQSSFVPTQSRTVPTSNVVTIIDADNTGSGDNAGSGAVSGKIRRRTCYECGEKGHLSSACPNKTTEPTNSNTS